MKLTSEVHAVDGRKVRGEVPLNGGFATVCGGGMNVTAMRENVTCPACKAEQVSAAVQS